MIVILKRDLKRKGAFGEEIEVADGYALNYLIPNGFAMVANATNRKRFEEIREKALAEVNVNRDRFQETVKQISGKTFTQSALSRDGKLYGSITLSKIVSMIQDDLPDVTLMPSDIIIDEGNIKYAGSYSCKAQFTKNISASFTVVIEADETHEQPELLESVIDEPTPPNVDEEEDPILDEEAVSQHDDVDLDNQASDQSPIDTPSE